MRTWDGSKFLYTQMGRAYFAKRPSKYIVEVPVTIRGRRSANEAGRGNRGRAGDYTREAMMPVSHFGIGEVIQKASASNLEARIKAAVLRQLPFVEQDGVRVVHQESSEFWTLDDTKPWRYSEMTVLQGGSVGAISFQTAAPPVT